MGIKKTPSRPAIEVGNQGEGHMADDASAHPEAPTSMAAAIAALIERIEIHELEAAGIARKTEHLGLDAKKLKAIRAAKKTLDALMDFDPALASQVQA